MPNPWHYQVKNQMHFKIKPLTSSAKNNKLHCRYLSYKQFCTISIYDNFSSEIDKNKRLAITLSFQRFDFYWNLAQSSGDEWDKEGWRFINLGLFRNILSCVYEHQDEKTLRICLAYFNKFIKTRLVFVFWKQFADLNKYILGSY